jgi:hypothetical protein
VQPRNLTIALAALALAACATKMVYQRLDFFIGWRLNDYVTLNDAQQREFKRTFGELWQWHRTHELPQYAQDLRELARGIDRSVVTPDQVVERSARFEAHWARLMDKAVTDMCPIVRTLDDAQAREIIEGVDDDLDDFRKEYVEPSEKDLRRKSQKRTGKWIKRWTGPLNDTQESFLDIWGERRRNIGAAWFEQRRKWRDRFELALSQRASSPDCAIFRPLFVTPRAGIDEAFARDLEFNEQQWNELIAQVIGSLDAPQQQRVRDELEEFAGQLEQLAAMQK